MSLMFYTNPESFTIKNIDSKNILHDICYYKGYNWYKIVDFILEKYPYLIFEKDFSGNIKAKSYDKNGLELGRTNVNVNGKAGNASYFDFIFDRRTNIEQKSNIILE
jgi:hypothetical protein